MKIFIKIEVPDDFETCLSMQQIIEREISADRWSWNKGSYEVSIEQKCLKWPDGYCLDPNGVMCPPAGKEDDFNFGYEIGFQDAWDCLNAALRARDEARFRAMKRKPMDSCEPPASMQPLKE